LGLLEGRIAEKFSFQLVLNEFQYIGNFC